MWPLRLPVPLGTGEPLDREVSLDTGEPLDRELPLDGELSGCVSDVVQSKGCRDLL